MRFARLMLLHLFCLCAGPLSAQLDGIALVANPESIPVGSGETPLIVIGAGFEPGWEARWNGSPRRTEFLDQYRLRVTLTEADTGVPSLSFISVVNPVSDQVVREPVAVWIYVQLWNNDFTYDPHRKRFWVALSGVRQQNEHGVAILNPENGTVEEFVTMEVEPQRLCLSSDGRFLYVATAGRIYRLDTERLVFDLDFAIPPTDVGSLPPQIFAMTTPPGQPDVLVASIRAPFVSPGYRGAIVFDRGIPRPKQLQPNEVVASFVGWARTGELIGAGAGKAYKLEVSAEGLKVTQSAPVPLGFGECAFALELLYCSSGAVIDAATFTPVHEYPARGVIAVLPEKDRVVFIDRGSLCAITILNRSTGEPVRIDLALGRSCNQDGMLVPWATDGVAWRDADFSAIGPLADRILIFRVP